MKYQIFQYPLPCPAEPAELNRFLASHRIASVTQHFANTTGTPTLVFVVHVAAGGSSGQGAGRERVDYRETLTAGQFALFSRLRDERKKLAEAEGVPVYAVFSNAQLAAMVTGEMGSEADLLKIDGVGESRVKKYGERILTVLMEAFSPERESDA